MKTGLDQFVPLKSQEPIFTTDASEIIVVGSYLAGKSLACAAKLAAIILDRVIADVPQRRPWQREPLSVLYISSLPYGYASFALRKYLLMSNDFWDVNASYSWSKTNATLDPFIPEDYVADKSSPSLIVLKDGTEIRLHSIRSEAEQLPRVYDFDVVWVHSFDFSEYEELVSRLFDRKGLLLWSATPFEADSQLARIVQEQQENPISRRLVVSPHWAQNLALTPDVKHRLEKLTMEFLDGRKSNDETRVDHASNESDRIVGIDFGLSDREEQISPDAQDSTDPDAEP